MRVPAKMRVPAMRDIIQEVYGKLEVPEIRVWVHPHKIGREGADEYAVFLSFAEALAYIKAHPEAERGPLVAFGGYELDLWGMTPVASGGYEGNLWEMTPEEAPQEPLQGGPEESA